LSKILVTGDKGFIGSNIQFHYDGFDIVDGFDIKNKKLVKEIIPEYDYVINLAAISDIDSCQNDKDLAYLTNVDGAMNVLENSKRCVLMSSASVYDESDKPLDELSKRDPISWYGYTKKVMEDKAMYYLTHNPKPCVILRPFNIIGYGSKGVVSKFQNEKDLKVYGHPYRDFVNVDDVIHAIILSIRKIEKFNGTVFNIGTGIPTSIREIAINSGKNFKMLPKKEYDIQYSCANISKARDQLNFRPTEVRFS
jgi:nucleoside-diphosphate-sugar epimerase